MQFIAVIFTDHFRTLLEEAFECFMFFIFNKFLDLIDDLLNLLSSGLFCGLDMVACALILRLLILDDFCLLLYLLSKLGMSLVQEF